MFSASTIINARNGCMHKHRVVSAEVDYAHKFHVPYNRVATVTAAQFETVKASFCLYRFHEDVCDDCGNTGIKYTQVIRGGKPRCIGCDCGEKLDTEMTIEQPGNYVLLPHKDGERVELSTCPMTFYTHIGTKS